jgi:hypothetical protein
VLINQTSLRATVTLKPGRSPLPSHHFHSVAWLWMRFFLQLPFQTNFKSSQASNDLQIQANFKRTAYQGKFQTNLKSSRTSNEFNIHELQTNYTSQTIFKPRHSLNELHIHVNFKRNSYLDEIHEKCTTRWASNDLQFQSDFKRSGKL